MDDKEKFKKEGATSNTTKPKEKNSSSGTNLRTNYLQERAIDKGLSLDPIQEELEEEVLQFKGPMTRSRTKSLEEHIYSKLMMLHEA